MDIQVDTPFVLHPQLERITPPDALRPYTVPGKPAPMQNGYFTPLPYKTARDYRNEFLSALTAMAMKRSFDNKIKGIQDGQANDVLERMSRQFNERGTPAYKPDLNNPLLQDPRNALYKQQADDVFNRMAKQFNERGTPVLKTQAAISKTKPSAQQVAKSKDAQAKLNNADWVAKYREMSNNVTPRVDPISMQSQMAAALRDPVYGQATATGLAAGEGMLNSWIAGINSRARRDEGNLANERWIKQIQDLDEDRKLRREELAEAKKEIVDAVPYQLDAFKEKLVTSNPENKALYDLLTKPYNAKNAFEAAQHRSRQAAAMQRLDAAQQSMPSQITSLPARSEITESEEFMDYPRRLLNAIPGVRRATLSKDERARANLIPAMKKEGVSKFFTITPEQLRLESVKNNREGFSGLAGQQNKIAELVERISTLNPGSVVKQSIGGDVIVIATPDNGAITITPGNFDRISKQYEIGTK